MSIALMAEAWKMTLPMTEKMVLLCLSDFANDAGICWPSVDTIAAKCSCSDRTVQKAIKSLKEMRLVTTEDAPGRPHLFKIDLRNYIAPENSSPPKVATKTPKNIHPGGEARSPEPSLNHQEPSSSDTSYPQKRARVKVKPKIEIPDWLPAEPWAGYLEMRKRIGKPATDRAIAIMIRKLDGWRRAGHDPGEILDTSTERNWTGLFEPKEQRNAARHDDLDTWRGSSGRSQSDPRDGFTIALQERAFGANRPPHG
jgi:hypothetical protein